LKRPIFSFERHLYADAEQVASSLVGGAGGAGNDGGDGGGEGGDGGDGLTAPSGGTGGSGGGGKSVGHASSLVFPARNTVQIEFGW